MISNTPGKREKERTVLLLVEICLSSWASKMAQMVKNLPEMQETRVQSLGLEDPLEKGMATNPSILAWRIPWTVEPGTLYSMGSQRLRHDLATEHSCIY